ncbi:unnamed protein product [Ostreobium quekettii]|uniref:Preprotein translocase subunit SecY n=1 Tax=Ostreobium quekettii TaxID=121088 RepID=A0A8S1IR70_9CHLO|nr:unnamed protein product [Ostreobium quekettii]
MMRRMAPVVAPGKAAIHFGGFRARQRRFCDGGFGGKFGDHERAAMFVGRQGEGRVGVNERAAMFGGREGQGRIGYRGKVGRFCDRGRASGGMMGSAYAGGAAGAGGVRTSGSGAGSRLWRWLSTVLPFLRSWQLMGRCFLTLAMLAVVRIQYFMPLRGLTPLDLPEDMRMMSPEQTLLANMFLAGDSVPINIAMLGITPIVVSSLFISIMLATPLGDAIPFFRQMRAQQKTGALGVEGVERTVFILALMVGSWQALTNAFMLRPYAASQPHFMAKTVVDLLAALAVTRHACSMIQDQGLGEGTGFLILGLTLSGFASRLYELGTRMATEGCVAWQLGVAACAYLVIVAACVWLNKAEMRLPLVDYSMRRMKAALLSDNFRSPGGRLTESGASGLDARNYLPLPLSQGGVTSLFVFSGVFSFIDAYLVKSTALPWLVGSWAFRIGVFGLGIFLITLVPLGTSSAERVSEFLGRLEAGVKGVIPGEPTVRHLQLKMFQGRFWGGLIFSLVAMASLWLDWQSSAWFGKSIGTLNLILLVAVISSAARQVESLLEGPKLQRIMEREQAVMSAIRQT